MRKAIVPGFILFAFLFAITFVLGGPSCETHAAACRTASSSTAPHTLSTTSSAQR